jgi:protoporphyrinogen oxidase
MKSSDNVPEGCSSIQFEVYFSREKPLTLTNEDLLKSVILQGEKMGLYNNKDIVVQDIRILPFGNVVFYHGMETDRKIVHEYLDKNNIRYAGRFGEWAYLWTDQSLLSGKKCAETLLKEEYDVI